MQDSTHRTGGATLLSAEIIQDREAERRHLLSLLEEAMQAEPGSDELSVLWTRIAHLPATDSLERLL
jgi:hypothetical protein